jgi:hypothetical protein
MSGSVTEPPAEIDAVFDHLIWRETRMLDGSKLPDLGLDKKALKARFERRALMDCCWYLSNATDEWLANEFKPRLDDTWRTAMGPKDDVEKLRYLSTRVVADLMRATGIGP